MQERSLPWPVLGPRDLAPFWWQLWVFLKEDIVYPQLELRHGECAPEGSGAGKLLKINQI